MRRPSPWLILVIILLGVLILREPRLQRVEDMFLAWFTQHSEAALPPAAVTQVEIGRDDIQRMTPAEQLKPLPQGEAARRSLSPLEYALFLQGVLDFHPEVIGIEPILVWRDQDKTQEQVFIDQAMRVPKLLVALELGGKGAHDLSVEDLPVLPNVSGSRRNLEQFTGIGRQPDDDIRLISTPGLISAPNERGDRLRVPMLFEYRGEIVPSFPLQAIMLWLRATPADVKVQLGKQIILPNGWKIPLHSDGTTTMNPAARGCVRRLSLNELLLAAQEHEQHRPLSRNLEDLKDQIILLRVADDPLQPPNILATTIATIQNNAYVRPASAALGWIIILCAALLACFLWMISRVNLFLWAIAFSSGYAMVALGMLGQHRIWIPTFLTLALLWSLVLIRLASAGVAMKHEIAATG